MRLKLITCEVFAREMDAAAERSSNEVQIEMLPQGLHEIPCFQMRDRIQEVIDGGDETGFEAVLLGYGLCSNGLAGICARSTSMISRSESALTTDTPTPCRPPDTL